MHTPPILDKHGHEISVGDTVYCPFRGGKHEGKVEALITPSSNHSSSIHTAPGDSAAREEAEKTINPPKVLFHDQKGRRKEHRPGALSDLNKDSDGEVEVDMARPSGQRPSGSMRQEGSGVSEQDAKEAKRRRSRGDEDL